MNAVCHVFARQNDRNINLITLRSGINFADELGVFGQRVAFFLRDLRIVADPHADHIGQRHRDPSRADLGRVRQKKNASESCQQNQLNLKEPLSNHKSAHPSLRPDVSPNAP